MNFCLSVMVLANLKYQNVLYLQDATSILFALKYFDILSLLLGEVLYSFCVTIRSKLSGTAINFHYFLMYDKNYMQKGHERWKIITVKMFLMC